MFWRLCCKSGHGIEKVRTVPDIASVVIHFDPKKLPKAKLFNLLDALLVNLGKRKPSAFSNSSQLMPSGTDLGLAEQEFNLTIDGMTCASCALLIEMLLKRDTRISSANVNLASETASVTGRVNKDTLCTLIDKMGYKAQSLDSLAQRQIMIVREKKRLIDARRRAILSTALSLPVMMIGMAAPASRYWHWAQHLLAMPIVLWAGQPFFAKAIKLAKQRATNMDSLIALGVGSSYGYSVVSLLAGKRGLYFDSATGIITFVLIGRYLEEKAKGKAHEAIRSLVNLQPENATVLHGSKEVTVNVEEVLIGDILLVRPGEKIPTDGIVIEGHFDGRRIDGHGRKHSRCQGSGASPGRRMYEHQWRNEDACNCGGHGYLSGEHHSYGGSGSIFQITHPKNCGPYFFCFCAFGHGGIHAYFSGLAVSWRRFWKGFQ